MLIEYVATKSKRNVPDHIGETLVARSIARRVDECPAALVVPPAVMRAAREVFGSDAGLVKSKPIPAEVRHVVAEDAEISPRTGKPKRRYKRRDIQAEE
jgi:hypothetical protein